MLRYLPLLGQLGIPDPTVVAQQLKEEKEKRKMEEKNEFAAVFDKMQGTRKQDERKEQGLYIIGLYLVTCLFSCSFYIDRLNLHLCGARRCFVVYYGILWYSPPLFTSFKT